MKTLRVKYLNCHMFPKYFAVEMVRTLLRRQHVCLFLLTQTELLNWLRTVKYRRKTYGKYGYVVYFIRTKIYFMDFYPIYCAFK